MRSRFSTTFLGEKAREGARIVVTTECFLDGCAIQDKTIPLEQYRALGEPVRDGPYLRRLRALAKELGILHGVPAHRWRWRPPHAIICGSRCCRRR